MTHVSDYTIYKTIPLHVNTRAALTLAAKLKQLSGTIT